MAKPHANLIEKFLAKWLSAQVVEADIEFQDSRARQLKVHLAVDQNIKNTAFGSVSRSVIGLHHRKVACGKVSQLQKVYRRLWHCKSQLQAGQSILSLDGYHVGARLGNRAVL